MPEIHSYLFVPTTQLQSLHEQYQRAFALTDTEFAALKPTTFSRFFTVM
ncbi:hypothetical protein [Alcaligenes faecalis]|nr:hypothetical protein [Alcaligenes faecalis]MBH0310888.1 hypothetical protein [Alcaligenes faecalis]MCM2623027.1 hypothetical protein [Alcaligenes faecalis]